jgi:hypothetical protein
MDEQRINSLENHLAIKQKNFKVEDQFVNARGIGLLANAMEITLDSLESLDKKIEEAKTTLDKIESKQKKISTYFGTFSSLFWALGIMLTIITVLQSLNILKIIWWPK